MVATRYRRRRFRRYRPKRYRRYKTKRRINRRRRRSRRLRHDYHVTVRLRGLSNNTFALTGSGQGEQQYVPSTQGGIQQLTLDGLVDYDQYGHVFKEYKIHRIYMVFFQEEISPPLTLTGDGGETFAVTAVANRRILIHSATIPAWESAVSTVERLRGSNTYRKQQYYPSTKERVILSAKPYIVKSVVESATTVAEVQGVPGWYPISQHSIPHYGRQWILENYREDNIRVKYQLEADVSFRGKRAYY